MISARVGEKKRPLAPSGTRAASSLALDEAGAWRLASVQDEHGHHDDGDDHEADEADVERSLPGSMGHEGLLSSGSTTISDGCVIAPRRKGSVPTGNETVVEPRHLIRGALVEPFGVQTGESLAVPGTQVEVLRRLTRHTHQVDVGAEVASKVPLAHGVKVLDEFSIGTLVIAQG